MCERSAGYGGSVSPGSRTLPHTYPHLRAASRAACSSSSLSRMVSLTDRSSVSRASATWRGQGLQGFKEGWRAQLHPEQGKEVPRASAPCQKRMGVRREMIIRDRISCDTIRDPVSCDAMSAAFFKRHCSPYAYPSRCYPLQILTCSASLTSVTSVTGLPPRCACISWAAWRACSTAACIARSCFSSGDTR